jgi:hypothetical protein
MRSNNDGRPIACTESLDAVIKQAFGRGLLNG